jgi:lysophospholipase L1-like esterase
MPKIVAVLSKELLAFALIELVIRGCAGLGLLSLPAINVMGFDRWQEGEDPPVEKRLYELDRDLIYRLRAQATVEYPRTAIYPSRPPTWVVRTNPQGFRSPSFDAVKRPGVFRIACVGDSSTFGQNVNDADAYPQVLQRLLDERAPGRFEVLNLGVPGYSSRQGLELLRRDVLGWQPDLVIFAFGTNDRFWRRKLTDDELIRFNQSVLGGVSMSLRNAAEHLYSYRLLRRLATAAAHRLFGVGALDPGPLRVSLEEIEDNFVKADALLRAQGSRLLVVNSDFYYTDAVQALSHAAARTGDRLVDLPRVFWIRTRRQTEALEAQHQLRSTRPPEGMALFRVRGGAPGEAVALRVREYLAPDWSEVPLHDDGRAGDERAGDGIWSGLVPGSRGGKLSYLYLFKDGPTWTWECRETLPGTGARLRVVRGDAGNIDTLGEYYLHSDAAHPDEEGYRLVAETLLPVILEIGAPGAR